MTAARRAPRRDPLDPHLCAAIVDRLTYAGAIIETGSASYRPAATQARQQQNP